jgi:hypothetical protein
MEATLVMMLAGRAAEQVFLGSASGGAANDIRQANALARAMVIDYGMTSDRTIAVGVLHPRPSAADTHGMELPADITREIFQIMRNASLAASALVAEEEKWFKIQVDGLIKNGVVKAEDLQDGLVSSEEVTLTDARSKWVHSLAEQINLGREESKKTAANTDTLVNPNLSGKALPAPSLAKPSSAENSDTRFTPNKSDVHPSGSTSVLAAHRISPKV